MQKKLVYICHPIGGDVAGNLQKISEIIRDINLNRPEIVPAAPYYGDVVSLNDDNPEERQRGLKNGIEMIKRGGYTELWVFGDTISKGMSLEIHTALKSGIRVVAKNNNTKALLRDLIIAKFKRFLIDAEDASEDEILIPEP